MLDATNTVSPLARAWGGQGKALPAGEVLQHYIAGKDRGATARHFQCTESALRQLIQRERVNTLGRQAEAVWLAETEQRVQRGKDNRRNNRLPQEYQPDPQRAGFNAMIAADIERELAQPAPRFVADSRTTTIEALSSGMEQLRRSRAKVIEQRGAADPEAEWLLQQWLLLDSARKQLSQKTQA